MKEIQAAVLTKLNEPLEIKKLNSRKLLAGQVLVKIAYSGICRSQLMEIQGHRGHDKWLPHLLGHEGSGEVIDVGRGVKKVKKGDEVVLSWIKSSGLESEEIKYDEVENDQVINSGKITTFSNYSVISENRIIKKPKVLNLKEAVLFGCALPTGAGMVLNESTMNKDSKVLVIGLGGVGLSAIAALLSLDINKIVAVDITKKKLDLVSSWGVENTINLKDNNFSKKFKNIYPEGADFCFESAGQVSTIETAFSLINSSGKVVFASHPPDDQKISIYPHELISGKKLEGTWGGAVNPDKDIPKMTKKICGNFDLNNFLSEPYKLNQINRAVRDLSLGKVLRPIIRMEH